jgi:ATP-binding cassette subfamily C (CFTR/MRP) protein 1
MKSAHALLTASIDYSTDHTIQRTIGNEFADRTLLCIAHRLNTIIGYDRILVLDAGQIAELEAPEVLYEREGSIFRSMCERSRIGIDDIRKARAMRMARK